MAVHVNKSNNFMKTTLSALFHIIAAASLMAVETNSLRRVDGVVYNPKLSKLWKAIPERNVGGGYYEKFTVASVGTNGVTFRVESRIFTPAGWKEKPNGFVFVKNCPNMETFYTEQTVSEQFLALPIPNMNLETKNGGKITVRAFDCGEPCELPK